MVCPLFNFFCFPSSVYPIEVEDVIAPCFAKYHGKKFDDIQALEQRTQLLSCFGIEIPKKLDSIEKTEQLFSSIEQILQKIEAHLPPKLQNPIHFPVTIDEIEERLTIGYKYDLIQITRRYITFPYATIHEQAQIAREWLESLASTEVLSLNCSYLGLLCFPRELCTLKNVRSIQANNNDLLSLPEEIGTIQNIQRLDVSYNCLPRLPTFFPPSLKQLYAQHNQIRSFPSNIISNQNLLFFDLRENPIEDGPSLYPFVLSRDLLDLEEPD